MPLVRTMAEWIQYFVRASRLLLDQSVWINPFRFEALDKLRAAQPQGEQ